MSNELSLTDEELAQVHLLVLQEVENSRVELHHTTRIEYREFIKQRLEQNRALLRKIEGALPALRREPAGAR